MTSNSEISNWTQDWPTKVGYYWMWSSRLGDVFVVEVSGGAKATPCVFFLGGEGPVNRSSMEEQYGHSSEWIGPLELPDHE